MREVDVESLVLDFTLYPRTQLDSSHVRYMVQAHNSGAHFPPPVVDRKSKRVTDGFHRITMFRRLSIPKIEVVEKNYKNEIEMFEDAMRLNADHGRNLTPYDRTHCILRAEELGIAVEDIAASLHMTVEAVGELRADRVGKLTVSGKSTAVAIKRTIRHMAGQTLTKRQIEANDRLGGMNQMFYVNQVIELIESGLLNSSDENLMERISHLYEVLKPIAAVKRN